MTVAATIEYRGFTLPRNVTEFCNAIEARFAGEELPVAKAAGCCEATIGLIAMELRFCADNPAEFMERVKRQIALASGYVDPPSADASVAPLSEPVRP
jgi:hypothetical protein